MTRIDAKRMAELIARGVFGLRRRVKGSDRARRATYRLFGEEVLNLLSAFARARGWKGCQEDVAAIFPRIRRGKKQEVTFLARLLNLLMPDYEHKLYRYYELQQYHWLYRYLQYPFVGTLLDTYVKPYQEAAKRDAPLRVVEYGAGIPYGLVYLLKTTPTAVSHITLVDLDLIYLDFTEFLIHRYRPSGLSLDVIRLKSTEEVPFLKPEHNMVFAKDVFEHLKEPGRVVDRLLSSVGERGLCFFDLRDHGVKEFQHVSPNLGYLREVVQGRGWAYEGECEELTVFSRGVEW